MLWIDLSDGKIFEDDPDECLSCQRGIRHLESRDVRLAHKPSSVGAWTGGARGKSSQARGVLMCHFLSSMIAVAIRCKTASRCSLNCLCSSSTAGRITCAGLPAAGDASSPCCWADRVSACILFSSDGGITRSFLVAACLHPKTTWRCGCDRGACGKQTICSRDS